MNPTKLDETKLEGTARELGYSYRRGIKPGAGYNLVDDISGEVLLDDYAASLKAIKEHLDNVAKQLNAKAKALGYSYERDDDEDRDGYVLVEDSTGDIVLGDGYTATLKDIRGYLDNIASDLGVEIEVTQLPKIEKPSRQDINDALRGHEHAAEIKAMAKSAKVDLKPTTTLHDLNHEIRALKSRTEFNLNWNNVDGLHDVNEHDENNFGRDLKQFLEDEKRKRESFEKYLAPEKDAPDYSAPKAATGFEVASINKRRIARSELPKRRTLLEIATAIRVAIAKGDKAGAGKLLIEAKEGTLDHGEFTQWAERETELTSRTCRNYMAMAQNGK